MFSDLVAKLIKQYYIDRNERKSILDENIPKIRINKITEKLAVFYEKMRYVIDYKEEHLLRKFAIKRILKRYELESLDKTEKLATKFLYELVQARYFDDNAIPEFKIKDISLIFDKYILLKSNIDKKSFVKLQNFILSIMSCEIEEALASSRKVNALMELMYKVLYPRLEFIGFDELDEEFKAQQVFIAINKSLMKADRELVYYRLMKSLYPNWRDNGNFDTGFFSENLLSIYENLKALYDHSLNKLIEKKIRTYSVVFNLLHNIVEKNLDEIEKLLEDKSKLEKEIEKAWLNTYKETKVKINKAVLKTILYLFITKVTLALLLEIPYDTLFEGHINYLAIIINILMPPVLMLAFMFTFFLPKKKNVELAKSKLITIIDKGDILLDIRIKKNKDKKSFLYLVFQFLYILIFLGTFGSIIYFLYKFKFNILSASLFLFFLSLVSYFAMKIRKSALDIALVKKRKGLILSIVELFAYPILKVGKWFTDKLDQYNLFVLFFDLIIESPFKAFVFVLDEWFAFMKEKEEEL